MAVSASANRFYGFYFLGYYYSFGFFAMRKNAAMR